MKRSKENKGQLFRMTIWFAHKFDLSIDNGLNSFKQFMKYNNFKKWFDSMKEELKSMMANILWDLDELPQYSK